MPTMTICQKIARKRGSDHDIRSAFFGTVRAPDMRGSAVVVDMAVARPPHRFSPPSKHASPMPTQLINSPPPLEGGVGGRGRRQYRRNTSHPQPHSTNRQNPYRIGGSYCSPPLVQILLIPRGTPIGVILRSHTSPRLPTCLITLYAHLLSSPSALPISPSSPSNLRISGSLLSMNVSTFWLVIPFSSALIIAMNVQRTMSNHLSSALRTITPSGSLLMMSGSSTRSSAFGPWLNRNVASAEASVEYASQRPDRNAPWISLRSAIRIGVHFML